jgi:hypothetical protein
LFLSDAGEDLGNKMKLDVFTYPCKCDYHLFFNVNWNLEERTTLFLLGHCLRFGDFYAVFNIVEVFIRIQELDVGDANPHIFK